MAAIYSEIRNWLETAKKEGATHVIVTTDTYDWSDYPASVMRGEDVREKEAELAAESMTKITEVYNLSMDLDEQMSRRRCFQY